MVQPAFMRSSGRRYLMLVALFVIAIYVIAPQIGNLHASWHVLSRPDHVWLSLAVLLTFATYWAAAGTYFFLSPRPLPYLQLVLVQLAAMFVNKLLPGGLGALGANYAYLRHRRHDLTEAASTVAVNNLLGIAGHILVLLVALAVLPRHVSLSRFWHEPSRLDLILASLLVIIVAAVLLLGLRPARLKQALEQLRHQLLSYRDRPQRLAAALSTSIFLTLANVLCLSACVLSLGIHLTFVATLIIFSVGVSAATATPTPGGLGGFEAGLFAALVAYHVAAPSALAAALLYRLVSYWLPLIAGAVAFSVSQKRHLFRADYI
jgi:uncharacterized membrane protein YbhN (UPF0104 family)